MTEMIYEYDGSFEGFLTCIFESYAQKEVLTAISCGEDIPFTLFPVRTVLTDRDHAARYIGRWSSCRRRRRTCCAAAFSPACRTGKCTCTVWW